MYDVLLSLKHRKKTEIPTYDYKTHSRTTEVVSLWNVDVVLFEGILAFHDDSDYDQDQIILRSKSPTSTSTNNNSNYNSNNNGDNGKRRLSDLMDLKIFVETDSDTRLARRVFRDTSQRGRTLDSVLTQYEKFVKPAYEKYIQPLKRKADVIIPWGDYSDNCFSDDGSWKAVRYPALDMIVEHIQTKLALFKAETAFKTISPASQIREQFTNQPY
jgi:uridine kinase